MKFICPQHGEVFPKNISYSRPALADCPECKELLEDIEGGIKILNEEEGVKRRPEFYKNNHPELYKKYFKNEQ